MLVADSPGRLYLDAAKHVRASQVLGRTRRLVPPRLLALGLDHARLRDHATAAAGLGAAVAPQSGPQPGPAADGQFVAFGQARLFGAGSIWRHGPEGMLYLFYLHGFTALAEYAATPTGLAGDRFWGRVVESWLQAHATPSSPAWHPYPTSSRLVAWCSALGALGGWSDGLQRRLTGEIQRQARFLRRAVEHDIGGNHLLLNAKALVFAGVTVRTSSLRDAGLRLLRRQLTRQILPDGGHEERSTAYHREIVGDLETIAELLSRTGGTAPAWLLESARATQGWLDALTGPDGHLPMLNDAWQGPRCSVGDVAGPVTVLAPSGYVALRNSRDQAIFDCGPLCPDHLPPHAHADALAFVLWVDGAPVIVDPGAYTYTGPDRQRFRGTAAHNTVVLDGQDQCVFWGDFRAGLLPHVSEPVVRTVESVVVVEGAHDGYRRLADPTIHHRALVWIPGGGLLVVDRLACRTTHRVRSSLTLAPAVEHRDGAVAGLEIAAFGPGLSSRLEPARYAPYLGTSIDTTKLTASGEVGPRDVFGWTVLRPDWAARIDPDGVVEIRRTGAAAPIRVHLRPFC